jgi:hypothetical protein
MIFLNDIEISNLINERKQMTIYPEELLRNLKDKKGHKQAEHIIPKVDGSHFVIKLIISKVNSLDFSAILGYVLPKHSKVFILRRYNGKSHVHRNTIEKDSFYDFHIHTATERYQKIGKKVDYFAERTDRYSTLAEALNCLIKDCNVVLPPNSQLSILF